ncbi:MAG: hypothetical protein ACFFDW_07160 [Candidatus Thorarchaeota archaeon]
MLLKSFWRNKKGQIQGVDFALAMIIFLIIFAEVVVLSLSFLQPKYQNLDVQIFETKADEIAESFFGSSGYPSDWEYDYTTEYHSFGLKDISSNNIDPNKLSRVNPDGLYALSYDDIRNNLSLERNLGFRLTIEAPFNLNTSFSITVPTATIDIQTSLGNCVIWEFVIAANSSVIFTNRAQTNSVGLFSESFTIGSPLPYGYYTLVVFAKSLEGQYSTDIKQIIVGESSNLGVKFLVQEDETSTGKVRINSVNDGTLDTLSAIILYPYAYGYEKLGNETLTISTPNLEEIFTLRTPTNGSSVILLTGIAGTEFSRKYFIFPTLLSQKFFTTLGDFYLPEKIDLIKFERIVIIRESIFKVVLYIWPE